MFHKVSEAAERLAVHVSRRDFLGWAGKSALAVAGILGAMLAVPAKAAAGTGKTCCLYYFISPYGTSSCCGGICVQGSGPCPATVDKFPHCVLARSTEVARCGLCGC